MRISTATVYRVFVAIPNEELPVEDAGGKIAEIIERAGWGRAFRSDHPTSCSDGYHLDGLGLEFEVATQAEQELLTDWLRCAPFRKERMEG